MVRYPHKAVFTWNDKPVQDKDMGTFTEGLPHSIQINGRFEPAGQGYSEGQNRVNYSFKGFFPLPSLVIPENAKVQWDNGRTWNVLRVYRYLTHMEVWI